MPVTLRDVAVPAFDIPLDPPRIPGAAYDKRCSAAYGQAGCDWLVVYADREHLANMAFLSGFEPRFEEALLLLGPGDRRVLVVGNEGEGYAPAAGLPGLEVVLAQSMSLMGQDRSRKPALAAVLRDAGLNAGQTIGLVGWKYLEKAEWTDPSPGFFVPHYLVAILSRIAGGRDALKDATPTLMHPADRSPRHDRRRPDCAARMGRRPRLRRGLAHRRAHPSRRQRVGGGERHGLCRRGPHRPCHGHDWRRPPRRHWNALRPAAALSGMATAQPPRSAIGAELSARAGLVTEYDETFLKAAAGYFEGLIAWYETADIGVSGGTIFEAVTTVLARGGLRSALNPGHLTGYDEWVHTPIRPGSADRIATGMPFQVDIIPEPLPRGWALNCEDGVVFADAPLRAELGARHPAVLERIDARRRFLRDQLGIALKDLILPLSSTPLCLPPFWLATRRLLARS